MSISEFFKGKYIFITGGSGFVGKVLIEKLLRSCDGIEKIYVLLREKRGKTPNERLQTITDCQLFDTLKKIKPEAIKKLVPIWGDVGEPRLGLTEKDAETLIENIDIVYHGAASVRFDDHLKDSILLNTRGTKEVVELALQAKKLVTFVHISTTYCNCDKKVIEEKLYPPLVNWKSSITIAEQTDQHTLNILSPHYIHPLPNTYTFAKSLSEHVVSDLCKGKLLAAIVRPSIVVSALNEPYPGWVDNFNGPVGLLSAGGIGVLKVVYADESASLDCIPVDILIKFLIIITYSKSISGNLNEVSVYNAAANEEDVKIKEIFEIGKKLTWDAPYTNLIWYPSVSLSSNWYLYYVTFLLYHMLPALILDGLLRTIGKKPMIVKIQRKIYIANMALKYFMHNSWKIINAKCLALRKYIADSDIETFTYAHCLEFTPDEKYTYFLKGKIAFSEILFKKKFDREKGFKITMILWIMDYLLHVTIVGILCWFLLTKTKILNIFCDMINSYLFYLSEL